MLHLLPSLTLATLAGATTAPEAPTSLTAELAALPAAPAAAPQEGKEPWDFSYTFVELGLNFYTPDASFDDFEDEVDSWYGLASLGLFDLLYVFGGYENQDFDFEDSSTDIYTLGVGAHLDLMNRLDLTGDIAWLYSDLSSDLGELDDTNSGYKIRVGGRWMPIQFGRGGLEVTGGITYRDLKNQIASDDEQFGWDLGARLHFLKLFSIAGSYWQLEDDDGILANLRVSF
jgi:hypothetical protein